MGCILPPRAGFTRAATGYGGRRGAPRLSSRRTRRRICAGLLGVLLARHRIRRGERRVGAPGGGRRARCRADVARDVRLAAVRDLAPGRPDARLRRRARRHRARRQERRHAAHAVPRRLERDRAWAASAACSRSRSRPTTPSRACSTPFATLANGTLVVWEYHARRGADVADAGHRTRPEHPALAPRITTAASCSSAPTATSTSASATTPMGANGQNPGVLLGKILRIDPRASAPPYTIPPGQPFAPGAPPEIYAYGFRNPWRFSFDSLTGDLLIGDVGENDWEEIDQLPAGQPPGANLGWNCWEGTHPYSGGHCSVAATSAHLRVRARRDPLLDQRRLRRARPDRADDRRPLSSSPTTAAPSVNAMLLPVGSPPDIAELGTAPQIAGFGQDSDGHLYVTSLKGGVWRVTGTGAADKPPVASFTLSQHDARGGCDAAPRRLVLDRSRRPHLQLHLGHRRRRQGRRPSGVTFDVSYPTAGARPITLTVTDTVGRALVAHAGRVRRRQDDAPGQHERRRAGSARRCRRRARRSSRAVRKHGLLRPIPGERVGDVDAHGHAAAGAQACTRPACAPLTDDWRRKTFKAHIGSGTVRLRIPQARMAGMRTLVVRVQAAVRAGRQVGAAQPCSCASTSDQGRDRKRLVPGRSPVRAEPARALSTRSGCVRCDRAARRSRGCRSGRRRP